MLLDENNPLECEKIVLPTNSDFTNILSLMLYSFNTNSIIKYQTIARRAQSVY
jgi:hypothetical protein